MAPEDVITIEGTVLELLPNALFRVKLPNGRSILADISGKVHVPSTQILPGDKVTIEMSPYDSSRGKLIYRAK